MDLYGSKRNYRKNGNKRKNAITPINIVIMILTVILVISVGIYLNGKWSQMLLQKEEAEMAARNNVSYFSVGGFVQIIIGCILFYVFCKGLKYKKSKEEEYDEKVVKRAVAEVLPNAEFIRNECIDADILYKYGIIPTYDRHEKRGMIRYQKDKKDYCFSNIHLLRSRTDKDDRTYYETSYMGQAYTGYYKTRLSGTVRIFATKIMPVIKKEINAGYVSKRPEETKIETENIEFNDNFDVYATSEQDAFFLLSPLVMEQLLEMKKKYKQIGVYISGNHVVIALNTNEIMFPERIYTKQGEADSLAISKAEVRKMLKMVELLEDSINGSIQNNFTQLRRKIWNS
ncbi:MAG: DUF3137 domain-containing protein [Lachnospiraceae bacterium]|nr:DUF3137 domain-containing protein [Lachnospiraceae bacterium]MDE6698895.1 DUF3137 domain-containing protein [Lachnospiraceae bacterium]